MIQPLIVLDTMVVIAAILGQSEGASAIVVRAVATGEVRLAISDDSLRELVQVVGSSDVEEQIGSPVQAFEIALDIGTMGTMYHPRRLDWPSLSDPSDSWVLDLAWEANADYIVTHDQRLSEAATELGFEVITAADLLHILREA